MADVAVIMTGIAVRKMKGNPSFAAARNAETN
jgi:hypothetical protein